MRPVLVLTLALLLVPAVPRAVSGAEPAELLVEISGPFVDPETSTPVIMLRETRGERRALPIWIGTGQASSIALALENRPGPRPNTHDLLVALLDDLKANVVRVVITELRKSIYHARVHLKTKGRDFSVDARPSDAIAIAVRVGAPVFVRESLLEEQPKVDAQNRTHSSGEPDV